MEKATTKTLKHVYSEDVKEAIKQARKIVSERVVLEENKKDYIPIGYKVDRDKNKLITTIYYKKVELND